MCVCVCVCIYKTYSVSLQLALQRHGGVDALPHGGVVVVQGAHLGVDQAAAGVALRGPSLGLLSGRHAALLHAVKLDCRGTHRGTETRRL